MPSSLQRHYEPMVSSLRTAYSNCGLVWDEWDGDHHCLCAVVRTGAYPIACPLLMANVCSPIPPRFIFHALTHKCDMQNLPICRSCNHRQRPLHILETRKQRVHRQLPNSTRTYPSRRASASQSNGYRVPAFRIGSCVGGSD